MAGEHANSWWVLILLGAFHGLNPAMGWLFAVALGLQEHRRSAVFRALLPIALGHALAIILAIVLATLIGFTLPPIYLRWVVAAVLIAVGIRFLIRHPHLRWAGMRVSMADLVWWSFLVASVHGAGLMVVPIFLKMSLPAGQLSGHSHFGSATASSAAVATILHSTSYLLVTASVAFLFYEKVGLGLLRKAWFNLDILWAAALFVAGAATLIA